MVLFAILEEERNIMAKIDYNNTQYKDIEDDELRDMTNILLLKNDRLSAVALIILLVAIIWFSLSGIFIEDTPPIRYLPFTVPLVLIVPIALNWRKITVMQAEDTKRMRVFYATIVRSGLASNRTTPKAYAAPTLQTVNPYTPRTAPTP